MPARSRRPRRPGTCVTLGPVPRRSARDTHIAGGRVNADPAFSKLHEPATFVRERATAGDATILFLTRRDVDKHDLQNRASVATIPGNHPVTTAQFSDVIDKETRLCLAGPH